MLKKLQKFWHYGPGRAALAAFCAHSVSISIGICQGYSAILIPQLSENNTDISINLEEGSWLASLGAITNPIGSIVSGILAEYFGRKLSIQISSLPFLIGWLLIAFAKNIYWLYIGRLVTGIAAGMSSASYTYVSEISMPSNRGIFQAFGPICASFGILLTYTLGYFIKWPIIALISTFFSIFTLITIQFQPESPSYLIKTNKDKTFKNLLYLRCNNYNLALNQYQKQLIHLKQTSDNGGGKFKNYFQIQILKPFLLLLILFLLQQFSGIYTILFYAINFLQQTHININNYFSSILIGLIRFIMSIIMAILINQFNRKTLCVTSAVGMSITMTVMAIYFKYYELNANDERILSILPLICVILNVCFSMLGMLPIPWILVGELFPLHARSIMCGIVICIAQSFTFVCVKIYPNMIELFNFSGTLMIFSVSAILAAIFSKFFLIETRNKTLQEIEETFQKKRQITIGIDNKAFQDIN